MSTCAVSVAGPGSCFAGPDSDPVTEYSLEQTTQLQTLLMVPALLQSANNESSQRKKYMLCTPGGLTSQLRPKLALNSR